MEALLQRVPPDAVGLQQTLGGGLDDLGGCEVIEQHQGDALAVFERLVGRGEPHLPQRPLHRGAVVRPGDAAFEHGELGCRLLHRRVEHRQLQADRIDLRAVGAEVFFSEGEGLDVLGAGELHAVRDAVGLGGGEAVFEFGQQGFFVGLRHRFNGIFIH